MKLGEYIRQLRDAKDLSLREFAEEIGKTPSFICDIELGRRNPSKNVLQEIADFFDIDVEELERYDERVPVEDVKKIIQSNPTSGTAVGVLLRKVAENKLTKSDVNKFYKDISDNSR